MKPPKEWHKSFYKNSFYNPASPAAVYSAPKEVRFIMRAAGLKKGRKLLDLCCGPGRHSVLLAKKGLDVTGYDFSSEYLEEAAANARKAGIGLTLRRGDMRRLEFDREFDAVINLFTSFGYFPRFADDLRTLKGVARALKPGGIFLLDIIHGDYVKKHPERQSWSRLSGGGYRLRENRLTADGMISSWTLLKGGKASTKTFFVRNYSRSRMTAALRRSGLIPVKFWGSFSGARLTADSDRLIVLARKAG